ncbi:MAG: YccF domain-containing protein [Lachnospiraceae bacterium]|nr:YccF domain-containing protein [Lachnospiraceae bacterium]
MRILGNILWIIFGGLISALGWVLAGCLWCITVVGIPVGLQCFKLASISLNPFGKEIRYEGGAVSFLLNVIWFFLSGLELALVNLLFGVLLCITIVGIPFGMQFFKIAKLALCPFGAVVDWVDYL